MSPHDDRWSDPGIDRELSRLISEAVDDVEPTDRFEELRALTAPTPRRPWLLATGGAMVAAAAVVTAIALVSGDRLTSEEPGPAGSPSGEVSATEDSGAPDPTDPAGTAVGVYYLGDTPTGVRLYREFRQGLGDPLTAAVELLSTVPQDPDYRTAWRADQLRSAAYDGSGADGEITVEVDPAVSDLPEGLDETEARLAVDQVVRTLQGAVQARAPVRFVADGEPVDRVLGVPTSEPVTAGPALETLALVNLTTPAEGVTVSGDVLPVEGVANSFEANVLWAVESADGRALEPGFFTAEGWMGDRLFPFSGEIDISSLTPGTYTLTVQTDDPTGGAEGPGAYSDTRTVVIE
ncbi:Gmad2 immunoglobulin-like domain-containing protein [Nocardioides coralli]|uniref:Gmad2 immunoglobulin-like domain-containing protein n=1 Tax=Nocardioides coralli TaxID=2872154 RepID=UPI001CA4092B|nr:Gmad2 immunoglobulin-like domain-containing protein [Nocardioides coralli]QZY30266.1 GerMN domain-containing protein [Nocardioides coralli]